MKILVTGANGQLGYDVMKAIKTKGYEAVGTYNREQNNQNPEFIKMDILDYENVQNVLCTIKPDAVIHCAAWTAVDDAERDENREMVYSINVKGTENIAKVCEIMGCKLIYVSSDYVFSGQGQMPYNTEAEINAPVNYYGYTKMLGERAVIDNVSRYFIVRTSWVYGSNGNNFVKTMLRLSEKYNELRVVKDQIGTPTYTVNLARLLVDMAESESYGIYHATNEGEFISWYDFACEIFRQAGKNVNVIPVTTEEYGLSLAKRPLNSRLSKDKLEEKGFNRLREWKEALTEFLEEINYGTNNGD